MKKKNLKNFIGQIFVLKRSVELIDLLQDDYVTLYANTCLMLLDIVPISVLKSSMKEDGYCTWDIKKKNEEKKLKHLASFLHGQRVLYYDLDYQTSIRDFYYIFGLASGKPPKTVKTQKQVKRKPKTKKWPPLLKSSIKGFSNANLPINIFSVKAKNKAKKPKK